MERQEAEGSLPCICYSWDSETQGATVGFPAEAWAPPGYCLSISRPGREKEVRAFENANPIPHPPPPTNNFLYPGWANSDACRVDFSLWLPLRLSACLCGSSCPHSTEGSASLFHATDQKLVVGSMTDISQTRMPKK